MKRGIVGISLALALVAVGSIAGSAWAAQMVIVTVRPLNGSGVNGTAALTAQGNQTAVSLRIGGYPPNTSHPILSTPAPARTPDRRSSRFRIWTRAPTASPWQRWWSTCPSRP